MSCSKVRGSLPEVDIRKPTRDDVERLAVGDLALDCFGKWSTVTEVFARGVDDRGRAFVCYYTRFGENNGAISGSMKEGEVVSTVPLVSAYRSAKLAP